MQAVLTKTWNETIDGALDATELSKLVETKDLVDYLDSELSKSDSTLTVMGLDALFRRRLTGSNSVKALVAALTEYERGFSDKNIELRCGCNVVVYSFLVGAKNFDFILPEVSDKRIGTFRQVQPSWQSIIRQLEAYERDGDPLSDTDLRDTYLRLRPIMMRISARDEHRCLCALLMSGPSTLEELKDDLGLPYNLSTRVIAPFVSAGIVVPSESLESFVICEQAIPLVLFLVRETLGVDPLSALGVERDS